MPPVSASVSKAEAPAANIDARPAPLNATGVLVVEDQPVLALDLCPALEAAGLRVIGPCLSYRDALAAIAREPPRFAVIDIDFGRGDLTPGFGGERLLAILTNAGCRCVVASGRSEILEALASGFPRATLLAKPTPVERVVQALLTPEG